MDGCWLAGWLHLVKCTEDNTNNIERVFVRCEILMPSCYCVYLYLFFIASNSFNIRLKFHSESDSIVPTDEELFAIGWSKAFDGNSGLYYYFTLDRSKIVWENPLATSP